ncbi:hypothetical protein DITRI_Ditri12bG0048700 [Diplodiscus trichospermus]
MTMNEALMMIWLGILFTSPGEPDILQINLFSSLGHHIKMHLTLVALQETVGVEWRERSLLFIDEEIDSNHYTSKSQSKQVEEVTCILWILSNFQLVVPSGSVEVPYKLWPVTIS